MLNFLQLNWSKSARELTAVTWGQELAIALKQCNTSLHHCDDLEDEKPSVLPFLRKVKSALRDVWKEAVIDVFDIGYVPSCDRYLFSMSVT
jgi:cohesin loading factor subunit SCC2